MENVAITGLGVISSIGLDVQSFNDSLLAGKVVASAAPWKDGHENIWMSLIEDFDPTRWMEDRTVRNSALFTQYAIAAAVQAVADAGIETFDPLRTAVIIGSALGGVDCYAEDQARFDASGPSAVSSKFMANSLLNMPCAHIALRFGLHGPQIAIATACASSHDAMGFAARMIESGEIDVAITGGTDCAISPLVFFGARSRAMRVMSPKGNFGHPHGPAGAVGLLAGLFSMQQNALMPTAGTCDEAELMPEVDKLHAVIKAPAEGRIDTLQVNAFGFGGQNASLIVTRA